MGYLFLPTNVSVAICTERVEAKNALGEMMENYKVAICTERVEAKGRCKSAGV